MHWESGICPAPDSINEVIMFVEIDKQVLNFRLGNAEMWLRYDIQAFYNIEKSGYAPFDIILQCSDAKAVRCFLRNGLSDWYRESSDDKNSLDDYVNGLMSTEGFQTELVAYIQAAIMLALPAAPIGNKKKSDVSSDSFLWLMTMFVDVMGAPRDEFMSSTLREATERWERYAVVMGYQKPAEKFSRFDDDDDDE